ncbi:cytochrome c biogenesis protein ResB [Alkaliphilus transvaalensis]|uniref:cytochrome c biogenesis protein ResB n=1 Tax=Alkaliphilus transvaalensis TaxID=114628 RepID=UPI000479CD96|nr:cytochrome c biogenesis protein ResB [Alkaliphilus transvaalensis]
MNQDSILKEFWKALHSMKFGIILLLVIGITSIAGTVIPQKNPLVFYEREYSSFAYTLITTLSLHDVYASWWFITMMLVLSLNLTLCSIIRFPVLFKRMIGTPQIKAELERKSYLVIKEYHNDVDVKGLFRKARFFRVKKQETEEGTYYFGYKNRFGVLGSWLTHVGILIIILAYMFGQVAGFDTYIYGVPGVTESVEETSYEIRIDDFDIQFRDDHTVRQYISKITVLDPDTGNVVKGGELSVNNPFRGDNFSIYQNGTGWALDLTLERNGEVIAERILYQSEVHVDDNRKIALQFVNFFPDYDNSIGRPVTVSPYPNNPKLLYTLFYDGQRVDMNAVGMGEKIEYEEYTFTIGNPRQFTLLQIVSDPGYRGAKVGGLVLLHGIMFAFYFHPRQLKAFKRKDGTTVIWADTTVDRENYKNQIEKLLENYLEKKSEA